MQEESSKQPLVSKARSLKRNVNRAIYDKDYYIASGGSTEFLATQGRELNRSRSICWQLAEVRAGMCVLDVGCGRGEMILHSALVGAKAFGIDYSDAAISMANELLGCCSPEVRSRSFVGLADAKKLPFLNGQFDRVFFLEVAEHLYPEELDFVLKEIWRVLKQDGLLVIHTMPNYWYTRIGTRLINCYRSIKRLPPLPAVDDSHIHVNEQSLRSLDGALQRARFERRVWLQYVAELSPKTWVLSWLQTGALRYVLCPDLFAIAWKKL